MTTFKPPGQCPACGEWVPRKAAACDCCGACERSGWQSDADVYDGLDLPDEDFNYDDFIAREFGGPKRMDGLMRNKWWWVALILLVVLSLGYFLPVMLGHAK